MTGDVEGHRFGRSSIDRVPDPTPSHEGAPLSFGSRDLDGNRIFHQVSLPEPAALGWVRG